MQAVRIFGAGPAGSAAAIAALAQSAQVEIVEKSRLPRHKVCGEFLSPGFVAALDSLDVLEDVMIAGPATIRRALLHFGTRTRGFSLPEPALGLSRYSLDSALLGAASRRGAVIVRAEENQSSETRAVVLATGRRSIAASGARLFGFKTHFNGPTNDAVELFFARGWYAGVCVAEAGITNVCGLAPEELLAASRFNPEALISSSPALAERLRPLSRRMKWLITGPVVCGYGQWGLARKMVYPAGDALAFIDPFTGSGILNAIMTGSLAGRAAVSGMPVSAYLDECKSILNKPLHTASFFRKVVMSGAADYLVPWVPSGLLYRLTRPTGNRWAKFRS